MESSCQNLYPGLKLTQCSDFKVLKGIVFDSELQDSYTLNLKRKKSESKDELVLDAKISGSMGSKPRFHYSCQLKLQIRGNSESTGEDPRNWDIREETPIDGKVLKRYGGL